MEFLAEVLVENRAGVPAESRVRYHAASLAAGSSDWCRGITLDESSAHGVAEDLHRVHLEGLEEN